MRRNYPKTKRDSLTTNTKRKQEVTDSGRWYRLVIGKAVTTDERTAQSRDLADTAC